MDINTLAAWGEFLGGIVASHLTKIRLVIGLQAVSQLDVRSQQ
jgi:hypothetical protein